MRLPTAHLGSVLYVLCIVTLMAVPATSYWATHGPSTPAAHSMTPFSSYDELRHFVLTESCTGSGTRGLYNPNWTPPTTGPVAQNGNGLFTTAASGSASTSSVPTYSQTNAQVAGVDELDMVKTDGAYLYTVTNNTVVIVLANPVADAKEVARISVNGTIQGIFIDGSKLVIISQHFPYYYPIAYLNTGGPPMAGAASMAVWPVYSYDQTSSIWIYDVSNHSTPSLTTTVVANGTFSGARLIGNYAYMVSNQPIYCNGLVPVPLSMVNGERMMTLPADIYHSDIPDYVQSFTTVIGIDVRQSSPAPSAKTFLIGTSSNIYVSLDQIYLTQPIWSQTEETTIHRISIQGSSINYEATGTVPGHVLNQFSMDEYNGYFRVATSDYGFIQPLGVMGTTSIVSQQQTNLYVLDSGLHIIGSLEALSPGEAFYAARFMGDRAYLVTYQRMDPLFVIGLGNPHQPMVLGQLNITGVSDYLQPYDQTHLIGIGKSSTNVTWENAALFQGLKFSFFDVTDPSHPVDTSNFLAGDRGSDSPALTDHRAVLFDQSLNLFVVPVAIAQAQQNTTNPWGYNPIVWQGAYVFSVTIQNGIAFRGGITHYPTGILPPYYNGNLYITRSLYIGNVLYTISNGMVKMNSLTDLSELGSVSLF
jgi:inhibitor of cysteine peptidase